MKRKVLFSIVIVFIALAIICGVVCINYNSSDESSNNMKEISVLIYDKDSKEIFNEKINTEEQYLSNALEKVENLDIQMQDSEYGKYITSIQGISEGDNYYWSYYINEEYATVGVSNCEIQDGYKYSFKIEKFIN